MQPEAPPYTLPAGLGPTVQEAQAAVAALEAQVAVVATAEAPPTLPGAAQAPPCTLPDGLEPSVQEAHAAVAALGAQDAVVATAEASASVPEGIGGAPWPSQHTTGPWLMPLPWLESSSATASSTPSQAQEEGASGGRQRCEAPEGSGGHCGSRGFLQDPRPPTSRENSLCTCLRGCGLSCHRRCRTRLVMARAACTRHALLTYRLHPCYIAWYTAFAATTVLPLAWDSFSGSDLQDLQRWDLVLQVVLGLGLSVETIFTCCLLGPLRFFRDASCLMDLVVALLALASTAYSMLLLLGQTMTSEMLRHGFQAVRLVLLPLRVVVVCYGMWRAVKFQRECAHAQCSPRPHSDSEARRSSMEHPVRTPFHLFSTLTPVSSAGSLNSTVCG